MNKKQIYKILESPDIVYYEAHGKLFKIVRKIWDLDNNITYWIYEKKKILFWYFWSCVCDNGCSRISANSVREAKRFINNEYLLLSKLVPIMD